ncbi:general transcription factor 3C polypeptide 5 isoform X2 [Boleophthalmus pectinirostris]|uniref:general transcription factor 3C polypeptide 5 isoform X2 n=1 Tax=Boleophthalmus pectinirostris TaxID=150288 RepID=UPI002431F411|nr:general transcription factor 3C polypeptide 5 isoform X2 [Boleophthalmus pectinirostris]
MSQRGPRVDLSLKELSLSAQSPQIPGNCACLPLQGTRLVCVEYPAVIQNLNRALESLGGEHTVSKTYANPNRRLELRLRPQDPFCHSLCGNRLDSSNLLMRVRRRVRKSDPTDVQIQTEILGIIGTTYKFQGMADFQCLAVHPENGRKMSLYDRIVLTRPESQDFFEQPLPYFLPPAIFSRLDTPIDYFYRPDVMHKTGDGGPHKNFIGLNRARRPHNAIFVTFLDPVPNECMEMAKVNWQRVCVKESDRRAEQQITEMFERRPIWSRNAVKANIDVHPDKLKLLLPLVAYYMVTGPWRSLWVRLGYDPRKSPESKQYQMLDFRIRCSIKHGYSVSDVLVKPKRSSLSYTLPNTFNKTVPPAASVMSLPDQEGTSQEQNPCTYKLKESAYIFREGMVPPHRQMFYQLCDLHVDSIQRVVNENKGLEKKCDERDGWCVVGTTDQLRDIISDCIKKVVRSKRNKALRKQPKRRRSKDEPGGALDETKEEEEEDVEFQPSEGSENEMETEMLEYM